VRRPARTGAASRRLLKDASRTKAINLASLSERSDDARDGSHPSFEAVECRPRACCGHLRAGGIGDRLGENPPRRHPTPAAANQAASLRARVSRREVPRQHALLALTARRHATVAPASGSVRHAGQRIHVAVTKAAIAVTGGSTTEAPSINGCE
jgi:hypothetical protein